MTINLVRICRRAERLLMPPASTTCPGKRWRVWQQHETEQRGSDSVAVRANWALN
jgi:hypothetical protein